MKEEAKFDDLPNIKKNIESQINQKKVKNKENIIEEDTKNINISKEDCEEKIEQIENNLNDDKSKLENLVTQKSNEINQNIENFSQKLENDTNEHINKIESLNLSEKAKKAEYIKCLEQLDNILSLSESLKECIEISENNLIHFLQNIYPLDRDPIIPYINKEENNLNKTNIYSTLSDNQKYSEKVFNNMKSPNIRNYIIKTNDKNITLKKLKINNYSDFAKIKEILLHTNDKNEFVQDKIQKISVNNLTKNQFIYLFNKEFKIKKKEKKPEEKKPEIKNEVKPEISVKSDKNLVFEFGKHKRSPTMNPNEMPKVYYKMSTKDVIKRTESEFVIIDNDKKDDKSKCYIDIDFYYPNIYIKNCDLTDIKLNELFKEVQILKLSSCNLSFDFYDMLSNNAFNKVTELYLENCNIVNENFNEIVFAIIKNEKLRSNLKCFSLKNNKISSINFYKYIIEGDIAKHKFDNLEMLDLSDNNIDFIDNKNLNGFPKLNVIDLTNNNFQFKSDFSTFYEINKKKIKKKKTILEKETSELSSKELSIKNSDDLDEVLLLMIAGNIGVLKGDNLITYIKYLIEVLPKCNYPLKNINLSGLFYRSKYHNYLSSINLYNFQCSLVEINLSSCNIEDEEFAKLLIDFCIINVKKMNLSNNKLTDKLFKCLIDIKSYDIYNKLKNVDLSNNDIKLNNVKEFNNFVELFDCIQTIVIRNTQAEENINNYIKKLIIKFNENKNGENNKTEFNDIDLSVQELIDNKKGKEYCFNNNSNIKLQMKNNIDYKFIDAAQKIYPDLFNKIIIEYKFTGPN